MRSQEDKQGKECSDNKVNQDKNQKVKQEQDSCNLSAKNKNEEYKGKVEHPFHKKSCS
jgi:hypothetical protein